MPHRDRSLAERAGGTSAVAGARWSDRRSARATRLSDPIWLEPYPDALLETVAETSPGPEVRYELKEAVGPAFVATLQHLPRRQRAYRCCGTCSVSGGGGRGHARDQGLVFAAGYLAVWTAFGAGAFLVYRGLLNAHPGLLDWDRGGRYLVAATAVAAGLYELTPIKRACLGTVVDREDGPPLVAALRLGADRVGCSVAPMVLLLVIGAMSITWMVVIAAILLVEKVPSAGPRVVLVSALGLIALGAWIAVDPGSAPGFDHPDVAAAAPSSPSATGTAPPSRGSASPGPPASCLWVEEHPPLRR